MSSQTIFVQLYYFVPTVVIVTDIEPSRLQLSFDMSFIDNCSRFLHELHESLVSSAFLNYFVVLALLMSFMSS